MADHVFISYSRNDKLFVQDLATSLKRRAVPVWLDEWNLVPGSDWDQGVDDALESCARMLVVLSPDAVKSREVRSEIRVVHDAGKPIIPLIHIACRIPRQLAMIHAIDFTARTPQDPEVLDRLVEALGGPAPRPTTTPAGLNEPAGKVLDWKAFLHRSEFEPKTTSPGAGPLRSTAVSRLFDAIRFEDQAPPANVAPDTPGSPGRLFEPRVPPLLQADFARLARVTPGTESPAAKPAAEVTRQPQRVGRVNHYWDRISVAGVDLDDHLAVGDVVRIHGPRTDFAQRVDSIERQRVTVDGAAAGDRVGLKVVRAVEKGDDIFRVAPLSRQADLAISPEPGEFLAGEVQQYFARVGAASIVLIEQLQIANRIRIRGATTDFVQTVESLQVDRRMIKRARPVLLVGLRVDERVRPGDLVYRIR